MESDRGQSHHNQVEGGDDSDSFYAQQAAPNQDEDKMSSEPHPSKHKQPKNKKKGISKKKEKSSKAPRKQQLPKEKEKEMKLSQIAQSKVVEIVAKMKDCYDVDLLLFQQKKMACRKLNYLEELGKLLKNVYICEKFIEKDGLTILERWMEKIVINETAVQPSVSLRKGVMEILLNMTISPENVSKIGQIQRLVARQKRSQIKQLRELGEKIILKWNQLSYEQN